MPEGFTFPPKEQTDLMRPAEQLSPEKNREHYLEHNKPENIEFFVMDHSLRHPDVISEDRMREIYAGMKKEGMKSIRVDWDWQEIFPQKGVVNEEILKKYIRSVGIMKEEGLGAPTIIVSAPPKWATDLLKEKKYDEYAIGYKEYITKVADTIKSTGVEIKQAQLFNEINHPALFNFIGDLDNFSKLAKITKEAFEAKKLDIKLSTSVIVGNIAEKTAGIMGKPKINEFLNQLEKIKDSVDILSLDYYPGMWHIPLQTVKKEGDTFPIKRSYNPIISLRNNLNRTFKNVDLLKQVCENLSGWGKDYEIGEAGFPTNEPYSTGRRQRFQYDMYFRALRHMMVDFHKRNIALPKRIGIYEAQDQANKFGEDADENPIMKWVAKRKIFPEHHFGLYTKEGDKKEILEGNLKGAVVENEESQLKKIVEYIHMPIKESTYPVDSKKEKSE